VEFNPLLKRLKERLRSELVISGVFVLYYTFHNPNMP